MFFYAEVEMPYMLLYVAFVSQSLNQLGGDATYDGIRFYVFGHNGSCTYNGILANSDTGQNRCACSSGVCWRMSIRISSMFLYSCYKHILKIFSTSAGVKSVKPWSTPSGPQALRAIAAKFLSSIPKSERRGFSPRVSKKKVSRALIAALEPSIAGSEPSSP